MNKIKKEEESDAAPTSSTPIEHIQTEPGVTPRRSDYAKGMGALLSATRAYTNNEVIGAPLAAFALRGNRIFEMSHDTAVLPLEQAAAFLENRPLQAAFRKDGTVTAGNASGLNDGAAAILLASENAIKSYNLKPLARIVSSAVVGIEPRIMGLGPVEAANLALKKAGLTWNDIDIIELNEAFAAQALGCTRQWKLDDNDPRINPNGGAIALGHPLGMSGARIINSAAIELNLQNKKYALATMCIGVGQGYAAIIEKA